jgi:hypothetical protein
MARILAENPNPAFPKSFILQVYDVLARPNRRGNKFLWDPRQRMKLDCYDPGLLDFAGFRPLTCCVLCVKLLNRSHGGPRTT